jgi:hypothetical protein
MHKNDRTEYIKEIMNCPKCQHKLHEQSEICPYCGIVFEKYLKYHAERTDQQDSQPPMVTLYEEHEAEPLTGFLFYEAQQSTSAYFIGRSIIFAGLIIWSWQLISPSIESNAVGNSFLHRVNLPFHEAGHIIFRPFGAFITSLGGTLGQLLMPLICMGGVIGQNPRPFRCIGSVMVGRRKFSGYCAVYERCTSGTITAIGW